MKPGDQFVHPNGKTYEAVETFDVWNCEGCAFIPINSDNCKAAPKCFPEHNVVSLIFKEVKPKPKPMTRKEAIKELKDLGSIHPIVDEALSIAIAALESLEGGIKAKAMRKKGTKWWYKNIRYEWIEMYYPTCTEPSAKIENYKDDNLPLDAVLEDIIIVTPKNE